MTRLAMIAAAALALVPVHASAGVGGLPPTGTAAAAAIPAEAIIVGGLVVAGGVVGAIAAGGGGDSTPTTTTTTSTTTPSDRRIKTDIHRIGETDEGYPLYTFRYITEPEGIFHIGVMAQDLPAHLVVTLPNGVLAVDHSQIRF